MTTQQQQLLATWAAALVGAVGIMAALLAGLCWLCARGLS